MLRYGHDAYGAVRTVTYPDGNAMDYAPDALGRATQVGGFATGVSYYPDGNVEGFVYGNGTQYFAQENARQLLSNFTYGKSGTLNISEDLIYDADGNITNVNDLVTGQRTKGFSYDGLNRLTQAQANNLWGTEGYTYDTLNNLQTLTTGGQTLTYNYDATNLLRSISLAGAAVNSFGYDARGNINNKNGNTLVFDQLNQLLETLVLTATPTMQPVVACRRRQRTARRRCTIFTTKRDSCSINTMPATPRPPTIFTLGKS